MLFRSVARRLTSSLRKFIFTLFRTHRNEQHRHLSSQRAFYFGRTRRRRHSASVAIVSPFVNTTIKGNKLESTGSSTPTPVMDAFEDAFSCPICLDEFRKTPKILPTCGHSFCLPCIQHWYSFSGGLETGLLRCPVCKCKTNLRLLQRRKILQRAPTCGKSPTPRVSALSKLLCDSPTVRAILKLTKGLKGSFSLSICDSLASSTDKMIIPALKNLLICRACHFRLEEPRMLPACRHSFCTSCLQKIYTPPLTKDAGDSATIVCPVCQILYRFNFRSQSSSSSPISKLKLVCNEKQSTRKPSPPKEKLSSYLPFDYVLSCLLEAIPEKL